MIPTRLRIDEDGMLDLPPALLRHLDVRPGDLLEWVAEPGGTARLARLQADANPAKQPDGDRP